MGLKPNYISFFEYLGIELFEALFTVFAYFSIIIK